MRKSFAAFGFAAITAGQAATPASAITFPSLTTIYIGSGVTDSGEAANVGVATSFHCTNVSGQNATVRFLVLTGIGTVAASFSGNLGHGITGTASTHNAEIFAAETNLNSGVVSQGAVNIESTESGVFCTATVIDASGATPEFSIDIHLVRVNPHPGTVE